MSRKTTLIEEASQGAENQFSEEKYHYCLLKKRKPGLKQSASSSLLQVDHQILKSFEAKDEKRRHSLPFEVV